MIMIGKRQIGLMKTNFGMIIALHQMKLQTCRAHNMKAYDHIYLCQRDGVSEQSHQELRKIKGRPPTHDYGCGAGRIVSSPVLLSDNIKTCSTSYYSPAVQNLFYELLILRIKKVLNANNKIETAVLENL